MDGFVMVKKYEMHINLEAGTSKPDEWVPISMKGAPPYRYDDAREAARMLKICYPDQMVKQRLDSNFNFGRIVEVEI